jgi:membrane-bound serine protease (ClpP class)
VFVPTLLVVGGFFVAIAFLVMRAQVARPASGASGMVGKIALVKTPLTPRGKVAVHGELWNAVASVPVDAGASVRIVKATGLLLEVEPLDAGTGKA